MPCPGVAWLCDRLSYTGVSRARDQDLSSTSNTRCACVSLLTLCSFLCDSAFARLSLWSLTPSIYSLLATLATGL